MIKKTLSSYILLFIVGIILRGIPELIIKEYPIGYDTLNYYAPIILNFEKYDALDMIFRMAPLLYSILRFLYNISEVGIYQLLKVAGPILYACLALSFNFFLKFGIRWSNRKSLIGTLICILQPVALRISWDLFRNEIGLIFMFLMLGISSSKIKYRNILQTLLSLTIVFTHQYVSILMFAILFGSIILKQRKEPILRLITPILPALILFLFIIYTSYPMFPPSPAPKVLNIIKPSTLILQNLFQCDGRFVSGTHLTVLEYIGLLFLVSYGPLLWFIIKGLKRDPTLDAMTAWLCIGSFSALILPYMAIPLYWRWILMLVFPFSIYATNALEKLKLTDDKHRPQLILVLALFSTIAIGYSSGAFSYVKGHQVNSYLPTDLTVTAINANHIRESIDSLIWVNENAVQGTCLVVEERFLGLALLHLDESINVAFYPANYPLKSALEIVLNDYEFSHVYVIWFTNEQLGGLEKIHINNEISIFR